MKFLEVILNFLFNILSQNTKGNQIFEKLKAGHSEQENSN